MSVRLNGQIISFYSYKGGVGRSMALANVAVLLAQRGKKVLAIDLDLEAPGLHRYFQNRSASKAGAIEFFIALQLRLREHHDSAKDIIASLLDESHFVITAVINNPKPPPSERIELHFMPAGYFDPEYPQRVHSFDWQHFYEMHGDIFPVLIEELRSRYDYVLIDSRTGITDIGSVCTVLLPDKLVLAFSPNAQSLHGAVEIARQAVRHRSLILPKSPLGLFPLPGRLEDAEKELQEKWISDAKEQFEQVFRDVYGGEVNLNTYFNLVRIQHKSFYSYGEKIAAEHEPDDVTGSMAAAFSTFVAFLKSPFLESNDTEEIARLSSNINQGTTKTVAIFNNIILSIEKDRQSVKGQFSDYVIQFERAISNYEIDPEQRVPIDEQVFSKIELLTPYRNEFVSIIDKIFRYFSNSDDDVYGDMVIEFLQNSLRLHGPRFKSAGSYWHELWADHFKFFLHELYIYIMAVLIKNKKYALGFQLLGHKYYAEHGNLAQFCSYTEYRQYLPSLEEHRNRRMLGGNRRSVAADLMKERATITDYPFEDLMQADFVLLFFSILNQPEDLWYPITNTYRRSHRTYKIFTMAESKANFSKLKVLFGLQDKADLLKKYESALARNTHLRNGRLSFGHFAELDIATIANIERLNSL